MSAKLATKLKVKLDGSLPRDPDPLADWSGHLFALDRVQFLIVLNTASLYSTIIHGRGITNSAQFIEGALASVCKTLQHDELSEIAERVERTSAAAVRVSKALNRSIVTSVNDLVFHAKFWMSEKQASLRDTCSELNDMPLGVFNFQSARQVMKGLGMEARSND